MFAFQINHITVKKITQEFKYCKDAAVLLSYLALSSRTGSYSSPSNIYPIMKPFFVFCMMLFVTANANAASNLFQNQSTIVPDDDSTFLVTVKVITDDWGQEIPVSLAVISTSHPGDQVTNQLGIAAPIAVKAGDLITITAAGHKPTAVIFEPVVITYPDSNQANTIKRNLSITIKLL
ncbi:hypothetical protein ACE38W_13790 [Chitinophaga sp. Hz27]|uniref:hypothetical protein n=1 Tax=Chitinophaga sp. Hz27 TaxID=3347169 RepID=UPI0035DEF4D8